MRLDRQTGMIEAIAYLYEPVNSRTNITAEIGAPITELATAAIPATAKIDKTVSSIPRNGT